MIERIMYKGRTILSLRKDSNDNYGFGFGFSKAKLILDHVEEIKKYVEDYSKLSQDRNPV
jgi:hypothetical protein